MGSHPPDRLHDIVSSALIPVSGGAPLSINWISCTFVSQEVIDLRMMRCQRRVNRKWYAYVNVLLQNRKFCRRITYIFFITFILSPTINSPHIDLKGSVEWSWHKRHFAHCSLIFYYLYFKFSNFVCPSELHPLIWFFLKNSFRKKKNIRKTSQNALAPGIFIVLSIVLKLGTPLLRIQAQNTLLQNF